MSLTPEQFEAKLMAAQEELTKAFKAIPPTENEVLTKVIMDYQYKATMAVINAIQGMNSMNHKRWVDTMTRLDELEDKIKALGK